MPRIRPTHRGPKAEGDPLSATNSLSGCRRVQPFKVAVCTKDFNTIPIIYLYLSFVSSSSIFFLETMFISARIIAIYGDSDPGRAAHPRFKPRGAAPPRSNLVICTPETKTPVMFVLPSTTLAQTTTHQ
jgi:hypothetical protein